MARIYFPGKKQDWLVARLDEVMDEQASGKVVTAWGAGDSNFSKQLDPALSVDVRMARLLNDLGIIDPDTYPPGSYRRVTRTQTAIYDREDF